ncbi:hypothetical protein SteCoe_35555 [Stentor coeruleus]|uniref:Uncharacterized protein n=1 Tax=Stentor coeruleus TaxID=5963 RepID=A0A1R2AS15_9CILI|nr:hypothetical protein SteCoe_35555 [Stentor coeruleus]
MDIYLDYSKLVRMLKPSKKSICKDFVMKGGKTPRHVTVEDIKAKLFLMHIRMISSLSSEGDQEAHKDLRDCQQDYWNEFLIHFTTHYALLQKAVTLGLQMKYFADFKVKDLVYNSAFQTEYFRCPEVRLSFILMLNVLWSDFCIPKFIRVFRVKKLKGNHIKAWKKVALYSYRIVLLIDDEKQTDSIRLPEELKKDLSQDTMDLDCSMI